MVQRKNQINKNDIEMYSSHNKGKSVVAERFIRTLKNNIYIYVTSISENVYIDKLDDIVNEYNNTYHRTIKMKFIDVKGNTYIDKDVNDNSPKQFHGHMLLMIVTVKKLLEHYMKKNCKG